MFRITPGYVAVHVVPLFWAILFGGRRLPYFTWLSMRKGGKVTPA